MWRNYASSVWMYTRILMAVRGFDGGGRSGERAGAYLVAGNDCGRRMNWRY